MQVRDECNKALAYCHKHVCGARKAINALKLTLVKRGQLQNFVKEGLHVRQAARASRQPWLSQQ